MLMLTYKHIHAPDGTVGLEYFRYADDAKGEVHCELCAGGLCWYVEPTPEETAVVDFVLDYVMSDWFLEYYGVINANNINTDRITANSLDECEPFDYEEWERGFNYV